MTERPSAVDAHIAALPDDVRPVVERVREAIRAGLPDAEERVRYDMPAVMLDDRYALHYAGWKKHVGLYPIPALRGPLEAEVAPYRSQKDSMRFPYSKPIPFDLIERLAAHLGSARRSA